MADSIEADGPLADAVLRYPTPTLFPLVAPSSRSAQPPHLAAAYASCSPQVNASARGNKANVPSCPLCDGAASPCWFLFAVDVASLQHMKETCEEQVHLWKDFIIDYCRSQNIFHCSPIKRLRIVC